MELSSTRHLLIFGGSFDPPHVAHVLLPELVMTAIGADAVAYVPAARQPLKADQLATAAHHRLAMLRLALRGKSHAMILTDELDRANDGRPSYTIDTLEALRRRLPRATRMRLLIGADQLRLFGKWKNPRRIIELAEPVVMLRPPDTRATLLAACDATWDGRFVPTPTMNVSATDIRRRIREGLSTDGLLDRAVADYIEKHRLYRD